MSSSDDMTIVQFKLTCSLLAFAFATTSLRAQTVTESVIHSFVFDVGQHPETGLIQASDGNFYGTLLDAEGIGTYGLVYRLTPDGAYTVVHVFTNGMDGGQPEASLIEGPDGALYGTTSQAGGREDAGNVFRLTLDGQMYNVFQFTGIENGIAPNTALTLGSDGNLYGVLGYGGPNYTGSVFKLTMGGEYTQLFTFLGTNIDTFPYGQFPGSPLL
jgi:uncharacterized repeat protein (TIGR03803 family)